ncbi:hypothetical protein K435DRAFT_795715 [Dendrothele bispora CBS 962.96]|uniref:Uncharacterized protein n=1 Tax=Dendrothele bispora (strain CBS 962.96) TaxID=1314807 RepID=A0A4S8M971_DENBC|nr:hypothetical protein K435DRAFT_795715 [Dendrothele bispora CBS 962.96]
MAKIASQLVRLSIAKCFEAVLSLEFASSCHQDVCLSITREISMRCNNQELVSLSAASFDDESIKEPQTLFDRLSSKLRRAVPVESRGADTVGVTRLTAFLPRSDERKQHNSEKEVARKVWSRFTGSKISNHDMFCIVTVLRITSSWLCSPKPTSVAVVRHLLKAENIVPVGRRV